MEKKGIEAQGTRIKKNEVGGKPFLQRMMVQRTMSEAEGGKNKRKRFLRFAVVPHFVSNFQSRCWCAVLKLGSCGGGSNRNSEVQQLPTGLGNGKGNQTLTSEKFKSLEMQSCPSSELRS
eukprot:EG_transcript_24383